MGQTRVDLRHLLEDLRDAYPGSIEETILTEIIANSLDSGAANIGIKADTATATLTVVDDGSGMRRRELARYHDLATSTKTRGKGIGFAGVGVKLGLLIGHEVVTESRTGAMHLATSWSLTGRHKAPWHWLPEPPGLVRGNGTAIRLHLTDPLSPLLDGGFLECAIRRNYQPLLDPALAAILTPLYRHGIAFEVNGQRLVHEPEHATEHADLLIRLPPRRKPAAVGWLVRESSPLPEDQRGLAVSTYGKVIKRGWDWLGVSPAQADRIGGLIEAPGLAECLTLNKGDFIRTGSRGSIYLTYRRIIQDAVVRQLAAWGDAPDPDPREQRRAARPVERDLEDVLVNLADDFPMLASLVEKRRGGNRAQHRRSRCRESDGLRPICPACVFHAAEHTKAAGHSLRPMASLRSVYELTAAGPRFRRAAPPTAAELEALLGSIVTRIARHLERRGLLVRDA